MINTSPVHVPQPYAPTINKFEEMDPRFGKDMNVDEVSPSIYANGTHGIIDFPDALAGYIGTFAQRDETGAIAGYASFVPNVTGGLNVTFYGPGGPNDDPFTVSFNFPDNDVETTIHYNAGLVIDMHKDIVLDDEAMQLYRSPHIAEIPESGKLDEADYKVFAEAQYRLVRDASGLVVGFIRSSLAYHRFTRNGDRVRMERISSPANRPPLIDKFYGKID